MKNMIKPEELSVHNYVRYNGVVYEVMSIADDMDSLVTAKTAYGNDDGITYIKIEDLEPEPVTENWLIAFGIENKVINGFSVHIRYYNGNLFSLIFHTEKNEYNLFDFHGVHHLQNTFQTNCFTKLVLK